MEEKTQSSDDDSADVSSEEEVPIVISAKTTTNVQQITIGAVNFTTSQSPHGSRVLVLKAAKVMLVLVVIHFLLNALVGLFVGLQSIGSQFAVMAALFGSFTAIWGVAMGIYAAVFSGFRSSKAPAVWFSAGSLFFALLLCASLGSNGGDIRFGSGGDINLPCATFNAAVSTDSVCIPAQVEFAPNPLQLSYNPLTSVVQGLCPGTDQPTVVQCSALCLSRLKLPTWRVDCRLTFQASQEIAPSSLVSAGPISTTVIAFVCMLLWFWIIGKGVKKSHLVVCFCVLVAVGHIGLVLFSLVPMFALGTVTVVTPTLLAFVVASLVSASLAAACIVNRRKERTFLPRVQVQP
eukprot:TRINITY_DN2918_c0_g1_i1.p1 TRINITY_DN2918_c0_g1~~TRINITY_DN2918_c0_g1_i1.p1  ORF type:complete len:349 (+),score=47.47 TRINITY_DN2918_c0_g1_i1:124-1170(+)